MGPETSCKGSEAMFRIRRNRWDNKVVPPQEDAGQQLRDSKWRVGMRFGVRN